MAVEAQEACITVMGLDVNTRNSFFMFNWRLDDISNKHGFGIQTLVSCIRKGNDLTLRWPGTKWKATGPSSLCQTLSVSTQAPKRPFPSGRFSLSVRRDYGLCSRGRILLTVRIGARHGFSDVLGHGLGVVAMRDSTGSESVILGKR